MKQGRSRGLLSVSYVIALHRSKSGSGRWPVAYSGKVTEAWITTSFFLQAAHVRMRGARVRQCCEGPTFTSDARLALPSASRALCCVVVCSGHEWRGCGVPDGGSRVLAGGTPRSLVHASTPPIPEASRPKAAHF